MMAVAAAQKNREMFAIKKSYSIEVNTIYTRKITIFTRNQAFLIIYVQYRKIENV